MRKRLLQEDFFSHDKIQRLAKQINKKTILGFNYIYIKDKALIKLLNENIDWLDYIGITLSPRPDKKSMCIKWDAK